MKPICFSITLLIALFSNVFALAQTNVIKIPTEEKNVVSTRVDSKAAISPTEYRKQFEKDMVKGFCHETKFVGECYQLPESACEANVKMSVFKCLIAQPPDKDSSHGFSASYGAKIGRCVGTDFQLKNKSALRRTSECQNHLEWLGR